MAQGIEVINDAGTLQVGTSPRGFNMVSKQTINSSPNLFMPFGFTMQSWSVTYTGDNPICAFACSTHAMVYKGSSISGSTFTFYFASLTAPSGTPATFYVFDTIDNTTITDNVGIEVFDETGKRTFHSSSKPLRILPATPVGQAAKIGGYSYTWNLYEGHGIYSVGATKIVGGTVTSENGVYHAWDVVNPPFFGNGSGNTGSSFLIDVTGY